MKLMLTTLSLLGSLNAHAATACSDLNSDTAIARNAVKSLIALAAVPDVVAYYGGATPGPNGTEIVTVQPHFATTKDSYKVTVRESDCRVLDVVLVGENLPLE